MRNPNGFTLAEVLITMGVIGIVAAMTIPTLIANIKGAQYRTKFKKVISTLSNAARMSQEQYGFDFAGIDNRCNANSATDNPEEKHTICSLLNGTLQSSTYYYGLNKLPNYKFTSESFEGMDSMKNSQNRIPIYQLQDGSLIMFSSILGDSTSPISRACSRSIGANAGIVGNGEFAGFGTGCYGLIDVNGTSGPNKEVKCSKGTNKLSNIRGAGDCSVDKKDIGDIFPILIYDGIVEPRSSAAWYVFNSTK